MRVFAIHTGDGQITAVFAAPADSPLRASLSLQPGERATAIDAAEFGFDLLDPQSNERLIELFERYHVEFEPKGKLVRKSDE